MQEKPGPWFSGTRLAGRKSFREGERSDAELEFRGGSRRGKCKQQNRPLIPRLEDREENRHSELRTYIEIQGRQQDTKSEGTAFYDKLHRIIFIELSQNSELRAQNSLKDHSQVNRVPLSRAFILLYLQSLDPCVSCQFIASQL